jgi:hypothetical protein
MGGSKRDWSKDQKRERVRRQGSEPIADEFGDNPYGLSFRDYNNQPKPKPKPPVSEQIRTTAALAAMAVPEKGNHRIVWRAGEKIEKKSKRSVPKIEKLENPRYAKHTAKSGVLYAGKKNFMEGVVVERRKGGMTKPKAPQK